MLRVNQLNLSVDHTPADLLPAVAVALGLEPAEVTSVDIAKRAIDARKKSAVCFSYSLKVTVTDDSKALAAHRTELCQAMPWQDEIYSGVNLLLGNSSPPTNRPVIVGTGPCGLFCGLMLARAGWRPILLERGKAAGPRARDVTSFWRGTADLLPDSNVQFGEGGAGTFSDGKLYTQIKDREHRIPWLLDEMVRAGAPEDILIKARPHIGTDRLIKVVRHIREEIISLGGEVRFETAFAKLQLDSAGSVCGAELKSGEILPTDKVILAVGHSARDTFAALHEQGVSMEAKPLSIGVRVEHPQEQMDRTQYGQFAGRSALGAAPYKFVYHHKANGRAAYSFCMCPGGLVVASSSEAGGLVTNGMSSYARAEANANAGFMVDISPQDYGLTAANPLAGVDFQREWERRAFVMGGGNYHAPIQTIGDFLAGRASKQLGQVVPSYRPGVTPSDLRGCLPDYVTATLRAAIPMIDRQLRGFANPDALLTAVETRSSSPVRLTRNPGSYQSISTPGLFPAGEGAGYAGGIISAAVDGMRIAEILLSQ
jgi:uncharacterized FAD-dependent dehydrogenase